jgi:serine/threonine protein kinase
VNEFFEQCLISCGNFGFVCKAIDKNTGKIYAIKKIPLNETECLKFAKNQN